MKTVTVRCSELCWIDHEITITPEDFEFYKTGNNLWFEKEREKAFKEAAKDLTFDRFIDICNGKEPDIAYFEHEYGKEYVVTTIMDAMYDDCWDSEGYTGDTCETQTEICINEE